MIRYPDMKNTRWLLLLFTLFLALPFLKSQTSVKDSTIKIWFFQPQISVQFPFGDMKEQFYNNTAIGFGVNRKSKANWLFGVEMSYLFAEKVRNEDQILGNITTSEGYVIDQTGVFANIYFRERGFHASIKAGKVFTTPWNNPNSGILLLGTAGMLQHKIRIENYENTAPQLQGDYIKGYDKLTSGPAFSIYLGYLRFSSYKLTNFSVGLEYLYAPTHSRRDYDFVLMGKDETLHHDQLLSLRFSWAIPFYSRAPKEFYIN
jgi:hypothetical protein